MSKIAISGASTGSATFTIESPATSTNRTLTLPDNTGTIITQNSTPAFASTIGVGGATAAASGAGITFPATQSASSDANTLDDYEEGTWTPTIGRTTTNPSITYSGQSGKYTKIGRLVHVDCLIIAGAVNSQGTGNVRVDGLPFASGAGTYECIGINGYNDVFADSGASVERSYASGSTMRFVNAGETQGDYNGNLSSGYLTVSMTYFV